jgi:predicted O-linked N-acetylglucosamine transferase (SPINDLY family)
MAARPSTDTAAMNGLGSKLFLAGDYERAHAYYLLAARDERALGAQANAGRCEIRLGRAADAEARARSLVETEADFAPGWQLLGEALTAQRRYAEAAEAFQFAVACAPDHAVLHRQLGEVAEKLGQTGQAIAAYERALSLDGGDPTSLRLLVRIKRRVCDWRGLDELGRRLQACVAAGRLDMSPFDFLVEGSSADVQLACARRRAGQLAGIGKLSRTAPVASHPLGRLRVGFVSHGFGTHPTTLLTTSLFEALRESPIEVHLFATNVDPGSAPRRRIAAAAHMFHDVADLTTGTLARKIAAEGIDILFDLDGYNRARMPEVFAYRPCPIQVNWLAYPGSSGAPFIDYVIADRFVLPELLQRHFSERVAYLPRCFQSSDPTRVVASPPSREACGLPAQGTVYVCFNAAFKINPRSFTRMLRILAAVEGSVLWLLKDSAAACTNLRAEAFAAGIDPDRLVFMDKLPHASYLARYRHADLFLDTEHYNAHTTASDALWAGCPVLTRPGETFATRVAGSLNHHLGMDEMNVVDDDAFVDVAVRYGLDAALRTAWREKLARRRSEAGLFDMKGFARDFSALLWRMFEHHRCGGTPVDFPDN